jgi:hypothetical protein
MVSTVEDVCYSNANVIVDIAESQRVPVGADGVTTNLPLEGVANFSDPGSVTLSYYVNLPTDSVYAVNSYAQRAVLTALPVNQIISQ